MYKKIKDPHQAYPVFKCKKVSLEHIVFISFILENVNLLRKYKYFTKNINEVNVEDWLMHLFKAFDLQFSKMLTQFLGHQKWGFNFGAFWKVYKLNFLHLLRMFFFFSMGKSHWYVREICGQILSKFSINIFGYSFCIHVTFLHQFWIICWGQMQSKVKEGNL